MKRAASKISRFSRTEIDYLFKHATQVYKSKELVILTAPCSLGTARILLVTSAKVGNAPQRNLLRRWGRALFYEHGFFIGALHAVIIFRSAAKHMSFDQFKAILLQAMSKSQPPALQS